MWSPPAGMFLPNQPFYWTPTGGMRRVPIGRGPGRLSAVNGSGLAVGVRRDYDPAMAFAYRLNGAVIDMGRIDPRGDTVATAVNEGGLAVGSGTVVLGAGNFVTRPFRWTETEGISEIPLPAGGRQGNAEAVNDLGHIVVNVTFQTIDPFVYVLRPGQAPQLLCPGDGFAINNVGQVVGYSGSGGRPFAFLYEPGVGVIDLNSVTEGLPNGWLISGARDVNESGDITVHIGDSVAGRTRAALLVRLD